MASAHPGYLLPTFFTAPRWHSKAQGKATRRRRGATPWVVVSPRIPARQRRATKTLDAPPSEAMCGVMAVVATCRLMAAVWHDRLVCCVPRVRRGRGDPGLRSTTALR